MVRGPVTRYGSHVHPVGDGGHLRGRSARQQHATTKGNSMDNNNNEYHFSECAAVADEHQLLHTASPGGRYIARPPSWNVAKLVAISANSDNLESAMRGIAAEVYTVYTVGVVS